MTNDIFATKILGLGLKSCRIGMYHLMILFTVFGISRYNFMQEYYF